MRPIKIATALIFLLFSTSWAYLEPSFRIKALGEDFAGIIVDEYTDIFRNPAYLALVQNYKILGEYRTDKGGSRLFFGGVLPKLRFGKIALLGRGWYQESGRTFNRNSILGFSDTTLIQRIDQVRAEINKSTLTNFGFIYSIPVVQNFNLGLNFLYLEDRLKSEFSEFVTQILSDAASGYLIQKFTDQRKGQSVRTNNQFLQAGTGLNFSKSQNLNLDLMLAFQHFDLENDTKSESFNQNDYYDSLGNIYWSYNGKLVREISGPNDQEGNRFGLAFRLSKKLTALEFINFQWGVSLTDWDVKAGSKESIYQNDTLRLVRQQIFNGDRENIDMHLKVGLEFKKINKIKLYGGIANFIGWEKQTYPDSLAFKPTSKFRNTFYKISVPVAAEYFPINKLILRLGVSLAYNYARTEYLDYDFTLRSSTTKTTNFNRSFGYSYELLKNFTIEGYLVQFGNLLSISDWIFGASYNF